MTINETFLKEVEKSIRSKIDFFQKLRGIPGSIFYDLFTLFRSLSTGEEKQEASERLYNAYFKNPIAKQRWGAFENQLKIELRARARERHTTTDEELHQSAIAGIFLAVHALDEVDLPFKIVAIPEWGGEVAIRAMTATDRKTLEAYTKKKALPENYTAKVLVRSIVDGDGNRIFSDDDADLLGQKSARVLYRLFEVARRLGAEADGPAIQEAYLQRLRRELNEAITTDLLRGVSKKDFTHRRKEISLVINDDGEEDRIIDLLPVERGQVEALDLEIILSAFLRMSIVSADDLSILRWHAVDDLTFAEIAQKLSIRETTARQRYHRARSRIRNYKGFKKINPA